MTASFNWAKTYGTSPGTREDIGTSGNIFNFMDLDSNDETAYDENPITASDTPDEGRSYEVWLQGQWATGSGFNQIENLQFWHSTSPLDTGLTLYWEGEQTSYVTPVKTDSSIATTGVPTSDPGSANVSIGGYLTPQGADGDGQLNTPGYSDYIVLQLDVATTASPGDTSLETFTLQYDES